MSAPPFYPRAFGALSTFAEALETGDQVALEQAAQGDTLADVLLSAVSDHPRAPREPELAATWALGWLAHQLADNWPDVAKMLVARADGGRP